MFIEARLCHEEMWQRWPHLFVKGSESKGDGLGLAFVSAVATAHGGGRVVARNHGLSGSPNGGAQIVVELPLVSGLQD